MSTKTVVPGKQMRGTLKLPGDKSISHRALLLSAIADGAARITGLSTARDVMSTRRCLEQLGVTIKDDGDAVIVKGVGEKGLSEPSDTLDAGNSGTTIRLLTGVLAAQPFNSRITGDESLQKRPMRRIIEPLENMGATIESADYKAPLLIRGGKLNAIDYASRIPSAQVKSCILLAGLFARGVTRVTEPSTSRDHTERLLQLMGAKMHVGAAVAAVRGPATLTSVDIDVPADISAAAFFLTAAALLPDSSIELENVGVNSSRTGIIEVLSAMGANVYMDESTTVNNEPRAKIHARTTKLTAHDMGGSMIPRIIDEIPVIAVAATQAKGVSKITDAGELRVKESDRLAAIAENLKRMGANVREQEDGLVITGPTPLKGAEIDSYGDHRIAMAFAVAGLIAEGETVINDVDCVNISFPKFFDLLDTLLESK